MQSGRYYIDSSTNYKERISVANYKHTCLNKFVKEIFKSNHLSI